MIDIVVPLYNEEKVLAKSVKTILDFLSGTKFPYPYTLTLANNASTDRSWSICQELAAIYPAVRPLDIGAKGKGHAVRTAWAQSSGDILVFMDCDLASDLLFLRPLIEEVKSGRVHMSIGNRLGPRSRIISRHPIRKIGSHVYNLSARMILGTSFDDHQCGFKAIDKKVFADLNKHLVERGWFFDTEMLAYAVKHGYTVSSIDVVWTEGEDSKVSFFSDSVRMFGDILRLRKRL
jgi:glycosyltransferase involved in cell wall biosynthesis